MIFNPTGGAGAKINGTVETRTIAPGGSISAGDFVQFVGTTVESYVDIINGIAKTTGIAGETVSVYVPE